MSDPNNAPRLDEDTLGEVIPDADVRELVVRSLIALFGDENAPKLTQSEDGDVDIDFGSVADA